MENDDKYVFCKYDPTQEDKYMWVDCCGGFSWGIRIKREKETQDLEFNCPVCGNRLRVLVGGLDD